MGLDYLHNFSFVSNENESYFTYAVIDTDAPTLISRCVLDVSRQIRQENYQPANGWTLLWSQPKQYEGYDICGLYGICNEKSSPFCNCLTGFEPKSLRDWDLADYSSGCLRRTKLQYGNNNLPYREREISRDAQHVIT